MKFSEGQTGSRGYLSLLKLLWSEKGGEDWSQESPEKSFKLLQSTANMKCSIGMSGPQEEETVKVEQRTVEVMSEASPKG